MKASDIATLVFWTIIVTGVVTFILAASYKQKGKGIDKEFFLLIPCVIIVTLVVVSLFTRAELSMQDDSDRQWSGVSNLRFLEIFRFRPYTPAVDEGTGYRNPYFVNGRSLDVCNRGQRDSPPSYLEAVRIDIAQDILQPHQVIPGRSARIVPDTLLPSYSEAMRLKY